MVAVNKVIIAQVRGVLQGSHAGAKLRQVKVGRVGGFLQGVGGEWKPGSVAVVEAKPTPIYPDTSDIVATPAADVYPVALVNQKGSGRQVNPAVARAKYRGEV